MIQDDGKSSLSLERTQRFALSTSGFFNNSQLKREDLSVAIGFSSEKYSFFTEVLHPLSGTKRRSFRSLVEISKTLLSDNQLSS